MAEQSGFFNAHLVDGEYDRVYLAESFAKYFASFIGNGIFGGKSNELMVKQKDTANMSVKVLSGQGWINGYWYENTDELSLAIDVADGVLNRIDLIVLRWDNVERVIRIAVKKGTSASSPSAPTIQRDADYFELKLAEIYVKAGSTSIIQANITDTRLNSDVCGFVTGVVEQLDTTEFGAQLNSFIENFEASSEAKLNDIVAKLNAIVEEDDVASLVLDVENVKEDIANLNDETAQMKENLGNLNGYAIESEDYPGCFYRMVNDEVEWINPPCEFGVEYRTTERYRGEVVYIKTIYAATLPNNSTMSIDTQVPAFYIVSLEGRILDTEENVYYPIPYTLPNQTIPTCVISSIEYDGELLIYAALDLSHCEGYFTIKYRKP